MMAVNSSMSNMPRFERKRKESKYVDPAVQVKVRRNDRIRVVSMAAEQRRASDDSASS